MKREKRKGKKETNYQKATILQHANEQKKEENEYDQPFHLLLFSRHPINFHLLVLLGFVFVVIVIVVLLLFFFFFFFF